MDKAPLTRASVCINGTHHLFKDKVIVSHESCFQPSPVGGGHYRWQDNFGVELPTLKFLNFKVNYLHTFESILIRGQAREDTFLTF